mgnify:CR=1 FL=1
MKSIITFIVGVLTFIFCIKGANKIIHLICSGIQNSDLHTITIIVLWLVCLGGIITISLLISYLVSGLINIILGK